LVATQVARSTVAMSTLNRFTGWLLHKLLGRLLLLCQQVYRLVATQVARSTVAMSTGLPAGCYTSCSVDCCYVNRFTGWLLHKLLGRLLLLCQQVYQLVATQVARSTVVCRYCPSWSDADAAGGLQGESAVCARLQNM